MYRSQEEEEFSKLYLVAFSLILGGAIGNLIDRIARPNGVVDFIDIKFYGLFGLERWPTFNVADMSVVVSGIVLMIAMWLYERRLRREQKA